MSELIPLSTYAVTLDLSSHSSFLTLLLLLRSLVTTIPLSQCVVFVKLLRDFFILEAHTLKILPSFSMVAGDMNLYPHVCTARTLLSPWLSLVHMRQPLAESGFPPLP